ncbi:ankyrin repeat domain-containing protein [Aquihabitans sp. McL0605]|uniref:ankyrin repeat domain-containing protein n=1 Tax=Aquihabitans sp. McL0605 TaxID=3415671 RepID=UPI003CF1A5BC
MTTTDQLFSAITDGDAIVIERILRAEPSLADASRDGITPLRAAAYAGHADLAQRLELLGARPDAFDAAALGDVDRLRELIDIDPDLPKAVAGDGFTALHLAAWFGHPKAAELLLAKNADPERMAANGTNLRPLHSAAAGGHAVIAHLLLDRGADIEAVQAGGIRPLHSAAHRNDAPMVRLLLDRGADPRAATDDGRTPRDLATDPDVLALLPTT